MLNLFLLILLGLFTTSVLGHREGRGKGRREFCNQDKAQARCVKIVQEWASFINTGNLQYLVNNYIQVGAALTVTGAVGTNTCTVINADLVQALQKDIDAKIKGEVITIKEVRYLPKTGYVEVHFTNMQGVNGEDMTLADNKWMFKAPSDCDYRVSSQVNVFYPCL